MPKCVRCGRLIADPGGRCECRSARAQLWGGIALTGLGGGVSLVSYLYPSLLGGFFVWKGACVGGIFLVVTGWRRLRALGRPAR